jgi:hypothetical protein
VVANVSNPTTKRSGASPRLKYRVFVSSVIDGFSDYRAAAQKGIEAVGGTPVMVNENLPSQITSPRNACLDEIESADCVLSIVGSRGGWMTPAGCLVVEEEFEHARVHSLPVLAFVQDVPRDADAERFVRKLSDYVQGRFRTKFETPADLQRQVERAVRERLAILSPQNVEGRDLSTYFAAERHNAGMATTLRLVLEPERREEVINPVKIASPDFSDRLLEIGHTKAVQLLSYRRGWVAEAQGAALVIEPAGENGRHRTEEYVRFELGECGRVVLDGNVTGRSADTATDSVRDALELDVENVEEMLATFFRFSAALYGEIDPQQRQERFHYNVGLRGLGHRVLARGRQPKHSYGMSMRNSDAIAAFPTSRVLSRAALDTDGRDEMARVITLLERGARE